MTFEYKVEKQDWEQDEIVERANESQVADIFIRAFNYFVDAGFRSGSKRSVGRYSGGYRA